MSLRDKVAIITGAGRGLGRAAALAMAAEGASVVILSRTFSEIRQTAAAITEGGGRALAVKADASKPADVAAVVRKALSRFGRVDILMNNAAVVGPVRPLHEVSLREWDRTMDINLRAAVLFCRTVVPVMIKQGGGKIINVTSGLGRMAVPRFGAYSVAKAGLDHVTRILAEELMGYNIQVNGLDPGIMDTAMQDEVRGLGPRALGEEVYREFVSMKESGGLKQPRQAARLAVFLASGESDGVTGEIGTEGHFRQFGYQ